MRWQGRDWPVLDGIPFLRLGREALADQALACLARGDQEDALVLLLRDQDDWWTGPPAGEQDLRTLVRRRDELSLREAMALLGWGRVADYFAHRWSDDTFAAGLALAEAHWREPRTALELCCGIGHHLRELWRRGLRVAGTDVVWAKLWVARHWMVPEAELLCFDAAGEWPDLPHFDLACCHDAFYFLGPKRLIAARLRAAAEMVAISHVHNRDWHNRDWPNLSAGAAVTLDELRAIFPGAVLYDDAELSRALAESRAPVPGAPPDAEAFSLVEGDDAPARPVRGTLSLPPPGAPLRRNPLYGADGRVRWPSERYEREYAPRAAFPEASAAPERARMEDAVAAFARRRELLDLPERW